MSLAARFVTHTVDNQATPLADYDAFASDPAPVIRPAYVVLAPLPPAVRVCPLSWATPPAGCTSRWRTTPSTGWEAGST